MKTVVTLIALSLACSAGFAQAQHSNGIVRFSGKVVIGDEHDDSAVMPHAGSRAISQHQSLRDGARNTHSALLSYYSSYAPANAELINITYR